MSQELAKGLGSSHNVRLTDRRPAASGQDFISCALDYDDALKEMVSGIDVIVHSGHVDADASASDQLDEAMRCTYNLLWAASEAGVGRFVYLSSLGIMEQYPEDYAVTEKWRPVPDVSPAMLGYHLGEFVCREYAREGKITVACLRLGDVGGSGTSALQLEDAVQAVEKALTADFGVGPVGNRNAGPIAPPSYWNVFHIQSSVANARYLTTAAQNVIGFEPTRAG